MALSKSIVIILSVCILSFLNCRSVLLAKSQLSSRPSIQETSFYSVIQSISKQHRVAFVIEGYPVRGSIDKENEKLLFASGDLTAKIDILCRLFDYELLPQKYIQGGALKVLRKKYTHPYDIPGVTIEECVVAIDDADKLLARFSNPSANDRKKIVNDVLGGLTSAQIADLSRTGIPVKDLSGTNKNRLFNFARWAYVDRRSEILNECRNILSMANDTYISSRMNNGRYEVIVSVKDQYGHVLRPLRGYSPGLIAVNTPVPAAIPDISSVTDNEYGVIRDLHANVLPVNQLTIQSCLNEKPLLCIGQDRATSSQILRGVAAIYGLRLIQHTPAQLRIERPLVRVPAQMGDLYTSIKDVMPLPLVRASVATGEEARLEASKDKLGKFLSRNKYTDSDRKEISSLMRDVRRWNEAIRNRPNLVGNECLRRLEYIYIAHSRGVVGKKMRLMDMGREARQDFAVLIMEGFFGSGFSATVEHPPFYITDFENCIAIGGIGKREKWIGIGARDKAGKTVPLIKMGMPK